MFEHRPFGQTLQLSIRGASHARALSFELSGIPAGLHLDLRQLAEFMERRAPGRDRLSTARHESDEVHFTSGLNGAITNGKTLCGRIDNRDMRPGDYGAERTIPRPSHADFPQWVEAGRIPTGGGANSGRLTAAICAAGGVALQYLARQGVSIGAKIDSIAGKGGDFAESIEAARRDGDSVGGVVKCVVNGLKPGLGGALFAGIESELSAGIFAIPGVKAIAFGNGFDATTLRGSENDDAFVVAEDGGVETRTNRHGGILGGRTSGMPIEFSVAFKPTPTVFKPLDSVDLKTMTPATCAMKGRHDPCIVRRAVPVVEAVAAFVLADLLLTTERTIPRVCLTLTGATLHEDIGQYRQQRYFTDLVELRVDLLNAAERENVMDFARQIDKPVLLTYRRKCDGGQFDGPDTERIEFFRRVLRPGCGFAYVDFEDDFRIAELEAAARKADIKIVRSRHDFKTTPRELIKVLERLRGNTDEIPKLACTPKSLADVTRLITACESAADFPRIVCAMGPRGMATRALASRTRSLWSYASVGGLSTLGHVSPHELVKTYRLRTTTREATLFGVTGWPLVFTRSPELHNAAFAAEDQDAVMVPLPAETAEEALRAFQKLGLKGMAVTYPHKCTMMPLLDAIDAAALSIGAVNTISRYSGGQLFGYNTDAEGFAAALKSFLGVSDLYGKRVAVIGAGGAARAVVYALKIMDAEVCIFNRTLAKAEELASKYGMRAAELGPQSATLLAEYSEVIVQCAAPGDSPSTFDPLAFYRFTGREAVYDLVYEPEETPTMARVRAAGGRAENGFSMLREQARIQRQIWERT